ncbi:MAG: sugar phosphate isomerase/epimerase [Tannerella sp.]|jgi:sugar phosphate isomerase/epimerase|nr:sugar phosphate isomerase/epimerase [Tannerella sp.]
MFTSDHLLTSRRSFLKRAGLAGMALPFASALTASEKSEQKQANQKYPFRISINTSTISGFNLPVEEQIKLAASAGFDGIELWISDLNRFAETGGNLNDLRKLMEDSQLRLENIIAFANWISNDPQQSASGMEQMKREMTCAAQLGGHHIAAAGGGLDVFVPENMDMYGRQFAEINRIGQSLGVTPLLELWGHGTLNKQWKVMAIAAESRCASACFLLDFYHLHAGGNSFGSLSLLNGTRLPVFHINDYPGDIPAENLKDSDRVYPGDGVCPFNEVIPLLYHTGFRGAFSLEIFNVSYWRNSTPRQVLDAGYRKTAEVIDKALAGISR